MEKTMITRRVPSRRTRRTCQRLQYQMIFSEANQGLRENPRFPPLSFIQPLSVSMLNLQTRQLRRDLILTLDAILARITALCLPQCRRLQIMLFRRLHSLVWRRLQSDLRKEANWNSIVLPFIQQSRR